MFWYFKRSWDDIFTSSEAPVSRFDMLFWIRTSDVKNKYPYAVVFITETSSVYLSFVCSISPLLFEAIDIKMYICTPSYGELPWLVAPRLRIMLKVSLGEILGNKAREFSLCYEKRWSSRRIFQNGFFRDQKDKPGIT